MMGSDFSKEEERIDCVYKLFGVPRTDVENFLQEFGNADEKIRMYYEESFLDVRFVISYERQASKVSVDGVTNAFLQKFRGSLYYEGDLSLGEALVTLLKKSGLRLSAAESFTGGNVAARIVAVPGASEVFYEGVVCYDSEAKRERLGVREDTLERNGAVSSETAYEMASGLLFGGKCNVAVATTGLAGPKTDGSALPVGLFFIAVGTMDGIRVFRCQSDGDRDRVIKVGTNAALFYTIQIIKNEMR